MVLDISHQGKKVPISLATMFCTGSLLWSSTNRPWATSAGSEDDKSRNMQIVLLPVPSLLWQCTGSKEV